MKLSKSCAKIINYIEKKYIISHYYFYRHEIGNKIRMILQYSENDIGLGSKDQEENALPGFQKYMNSNYYKYMIARYLYSIKYIKNKAVLDSGCGFGWGAFLISHYPREIVSIDRDQGALDFAVAHWRDKKIIFKNHSVLDLDSLGKRFDVILGYELVEHLTFEQCLIYLAQVFTNLKENGMLIMSSYFPRSKNHTEKLQENKYHLHIFTQEEIKNIGKKIGFSKVRFWGDFMVVIRK
ncbi:MAG: class I SAM-dependent methyltransferase [bacterium]